MSDRVNNELLSAYLDNEVTAEERVRVEQALSESPAARSSLESLKQVQTRLRSLPRMSLPNDFHERVLREAERRQAERRQAEQGVVVRSGRAGDASKWMRFVAVAATVAAVLLVAVLIATNPRDSEIVENGDPGGTDVVQQGSSLPGEDVLVDAGPRPQPKYIMVLDLAITRKAQENGLFEEALTQIGIAFDARNEGVVLDEKLRNDLLGTRFIAGVGEQPADQANEQFDVIDMVYVHGTAAQFDDLHQRMMLHEQVRAVLDLALQPESTQVLNSIGERSWSLASAEADGVPRSYAYRLNVGITLHSSRSGFFAKFPTPGFDVRVLEKGDKSGSATGFSLPIPLEFGGHQPGPGDPNELGAEVIEDPIYEILVIRRNLQAGFPEKPAAE